MNRFTNDMRRARLARRHCLLQPASDVLEATSSLTALHSSDPSTVFLTLQARVEGFQTQDLETALYEQRTLFRVYGMRRTLWVVDRKTLSLVDRSSTNLIAPPNRRRYERMLVDGGVTKDGGRWLDEVQARTVRAIRARGQALARELTDDVPELVNKLEYYNKKGKLIGSTGVSTSTLVQLALESKITRARPVGTWISSQYRWVEMEDWLGGPIPEIAAADAAAGLIERWLRQFGPATTNDIKWWTGWTVARTKKAIEAVGAVEVELDQGTGWVLPGDHEEAALEQDWVALLPSLDPTTMGWKERDWYLGDYYPTLFDRNGNAGPTVWVNGRIIGGWAQRKDGEVVFELFEDVGETTKRAIESRAAAVQSWIGDIRVTPRFRSPHDKELSA